MEEKNLITNKTPTLRPISPTTIKCYIPVRSHLPTPIPSPTCSGMFDCIEPDYKLTHCGRI